MNLKLDYQKDVLKGSIVLPSSKSISNRLLVIQHLSEGRVSVGNLSDASDTQLMISILQKIHPLNHERKVYHYTENAGTVMRFLLPVCALTPGSWFLTGTDRMKQRPIEPLVSALNNLGATISYAEEEGYPPLNIKGGALLGGCVESDARQSSQFISALLMAAPYFIKGLILKIPEKPVSEPYIQMTIGLMNEAGVFVRVSENEVNGVSPGFVEYNVRPAKYQSVKLDVEADWSSASYIYAMAVFSAKAELFVPNLREHSLQGDSVIVDLMKQFGVNTTFLPNGIQIVKNENVIPRTFEFCGKNHPDIVQTLMVVCAGKGVQAKFTGIATLRFKETDRIDAMVKNLQKMGVNVQISSDEIILTGQVNRQSTHLIETFNDHRMAMAFTPLVITGYSLTIEKSDVVKKSFPNFWHQCKELGFTLTAV